MNRTVAELMPIKMNVNTTIKSPTLVAVIFLVMAATVTSEGQLKCSVEKRPLKEVREQFKRQRNEIPTKHFHACKLKAYDNQA